LCLATGPKGYYSTFQGLSIVYLSGTETARKEESTKKLKSANKDEAEQECLVEFNTDEVESIIGNLEKRHAGECVDLLLTNQWPMFVENLSNQELVGCLLLYVHLYLYQTSIK
jgi:hypothetical protein